MNSNNAFGNFIIDKIETERNRIEKAAKGSITGVAKEATGQLGIGSLFPEKTPEQQTTETKNWLYGPSTPVERQNHGFAPKAAEPALAHLSTPDQDQNKMSLIRDQLKNVQKGSPGPLKHAATPGVQQMHRQYFNSTFERPRQPEISTTERLEREDNQKRWELQEKARKAPPPIRAQTRIERRQGGE